MITRVRVRSVVRKRIPVVQEMLQIRDGDCKPQTLAKLQLHVDHSSHLTTLVEQRAATVARVDLSRRLDVDNAVHVAVASTDNALRHRSLKPQRTANRKHRITLAMSIVSGQSHRAERHVRLSRNLQQREVKVRIQRQNLHIPNRPTLKIPFLPAMKDRDRNPRLTLNHMVIRDTVTTGIDDESRSQASRSLNQHHTLTKGLHQFLDRPLRQLSGKKQGFHRSRFGGIRSLSAFALLNLIHRNPDYVHTHVHKQSVLLHLQDLALHPLPGLQHNHITHRHHAAGQHHDAQQRSPAQRKTIHSSLHRRSSSQKLC